MQADAAVLIARGGDPNHAAFGPVASLPVANRSLLEHAVDTLSQAGIVKIAVIADAAVEDECLRLAADHASATDIAVFTQTGEELEEALTLAGPVVGDEPFVLHLGDCLCWDPDLSWRDGEFTPADALVLVQPNPGNGAAAARAASAPNRALGPQHLGIYLVGPQLGEAACAVGDRRGLAAQTRAAVSVLGQRGGRTHYVRQGSSWRYGRAPGNLLAANQLALERLQGRPVTAAVTESELHGAVDIHPSAVIESSVIRGPVTIGSGTRIHESYIGPFTAIGGDVEIDGAEIAYSVVMDGASVRHVRERLEASLVGPKARISRDFRPPRALRLEIGARAEVVLA
jgi:glucose-1-phosphate thymidylyltransferase